MGAAPVLRYKNTEVPRQPGEVGRLRVLQGPDEGLVYVIKSSNFTIGRGDDADVVVSDARTSRSHARIQYTKDGWIVTDLGSANGILYQGEYVRKFSLNSGEHFTVGETLIEFQGAEAATSVLNAPRSPLELVQADQALASQKNRIRASAQSPKVKADPSKKNGSRTLLLLAAAAGVYFYMDQEPQKKKVAPKKEQVAKAQEEKNLASYLPVGVSKDVEKTADQYYRQGFREYREGNYLRAKAQFELTLQVNPNHQLARHYLKSSEKEIDDEIKRMIDGAATAKSAGRLREAKGYYETAMRLMYYDRSNPDFLECEEGLKKINEELTRGQ